MLSCPASTLQFRTCRSGLHGVSSRVTGGAVQKLLSDAQALLIEAASTLGPCVGAADSIHNDEVWGLRERSAAAIQQRGAETQVRVQQDRAAGRVLCRRLHCWCVLRCGFAACRQPGVQAQLCQGTPRLPSLYQICQLNVTGLVASLRPKSHCTLLHL